MAIVRRRWMLLTMNARLSHSTAAIDLWQQKWIVHQSLSHGRRNGNVNSDKKSSDLDDRLRAEPSAENHSSMNMANASAKRLIESIPFESSEVSLISYSCNSLIL